MPAPLVRKYKGRKTKDGKGPEAAWKRAKEIVVHRSDKPEADFSDRDWGLVTTIFKKMFGETAMTAQEMIDQVAEGTDPEDVLSVDEAIRLKMFPYAHRLPEWELEEMVSASLKSNLEGILIIAKQFEREVKSRRLSPEGLKFLQPLLKAISTAADAVESFERKLDDESRLRFLSDGGPMSTRDP